MACSKVFAQPSTVTGSIGVISAKFSAAALLQKLNVWTTVTTAAEDRYAGMQHAAHRPWSEDEWARMNSWTREIYDGECSSDREGYPVTAI
jgi:protease-4